jgi:hypothetical protein
MFIVIQIALVLVGFVFMARGKFTIGDREVTNPVASLVGIILVAQLPLALLLGITLNLTDGTPATTAVQVPSRAGQPVQVVNVPVSGSASEYWWVDPLITCGAVLAAAGLTGIALRSANETEEVFARLGPADTHAAP